MTSKTDEKIGGPKTEISTLAFQLLGQKNKTLLNFQLVWERQIKTQFFSVLISIFGFQEHNID